MDENAIRRVQRDFLSFPQDIYDIVKDTMTNKMTAEEREEVMTKAYSKNVAYQKKSQLAMFVRELSATERYSLVRLLTLHNTPLEELSFSQLIAFSFANTEDHEDIVDRMATTESDSSTYLNSYLRAKREVEFDKHFINLKLQLKRIERVLYPTEYVLYQLDGDSKFGADSHATSNDLQTERLPATAVLPSNSNASFNLNSNSAHSSTSKMTSDLTSLAKTISSPSHDSSKDQESLYEALSITPDIADTISYINLLRPRISEIEKMKECLEDIDKFKEYYDMMKSEFPFFLDYAAEMPEFSKLGAEMPELDKLRKPMPEFEKFKKLVPIFDRKSDLPDIGWINKHYPDFEKLKLEIPDFDMLEECLPDIKMLRDEINKLAARVMANKSRTTTKAGGE